MANLDDILLGSNAPVACTIDGVTRQISVPDDWKEFGVESDEDVTRIPFICPKVVGDNIDLSSFTININYINAAGFPGVYTVSDLQTDVQGLGSDVNDLQGTVSTVQQTATGLTSTVTQQGQTISEIRQDLDSINLTGYVTFNDLETSGSTTINGSNITTGSISADRISGGTIDADTINVSNLNASNLTKGLISANRISDASNYLANLYATNVYTAINYAQTVQLVSSGSAGLENYGTVLKPNGVYLKNGGSTTLLATWQQMADGGTTTTKTAVFG